MFSKPATGLLKDTPIAGSFASPVEPGSTYQNRVPQYPTSYKAVRQFMTTFEQETPDTPAWPSEEVYRLRVRVMLEEFFETLCGLYAADPVAILDGLVDCDYVNTGSAIAFGLSYEAAFMEGHSSNMSKIDPAVGKPVKDEYGKVIKPASYTPANFAQFVERLIGTKPPYDTAEIVIEELSKTFGSIKFQSLMRHKNRFLY